jgi:hypothetical protein
MKLSGNLHAPTALPTVRDLPVLVEYEAERAPDPVWSLWQTEKSCFCQETFSDRIALRLSLLSLIVQLFLWVHNSIITEGAGNLLDLKC